MLNVGSRSCHSLGVKERGFPSFALLLTRSLRSLCRRAAGAVSFFGGSFEMRNSCLTKHAGTTAGIIVAVLFVAHLLTPHSLRSHSSMVVWVVPSLVRVGPTDAPGPVSSVTLSGARGEFVDAQLIVTAPSDGTLTGVN